MPVPATTYDVALVLDDARRWLTEARLAVERIRHAHSRAVLPSLDVLFLQPSLLVCLLHFDAERYSTELLTQAATEARRGHFRVLKPMMLDDRERQNFYQQRLGTFTFRRLDVQDLEQTFQELQVLLSPPAGVSAAAPPSDGPLYRVYFFDEDEFLRAHEDGTQPGDNTSVRLYVETDQPPPPGSTVRLAIETATGQGPVVVTAIAEHDVLPVDDAPREAGLGFWAALKLDPAELNLFESFLISVRRRSEWPEKSGRRYERFPLRLRVEYLWQGEMRREYTDNLSRGGVFIDSFDPPPIDAELTLHLFSAGAHSGVMMEGRVVYSVDAASAASAGVRAGAGVRFTEPASVTRHRLEALLASNRVEPQRRALVVDDDRFWRTVVANGLSLAGYEVLQAEDGIQGFQVLLDELLRLDVLILDIYMPRLGGVDLLDRVRRVGQEEDLTIVFLTGKDVSAEEEVSFRALGVDDVIPKSASPEDIIERIEAAARTPLAQGE